MGIARMEKNVYIYIWIPLQNYHHVRIMKKVFVYLDLCAPKGMFEKYYASSIWLGSVRKARTARMLILDGLKIYLRLLKE